jgi:DNA topoisomerase-2
MAIWSLTQERVEKLLKQISEKQEEIDTLIKLSPKDIWAVDLEAFMDEWNTQLDEEVKRKKKIAGITRRASQKLGIGAGKGAKSKKKRKTGDSDSDDSGSDFGPVKKKAKPKKEGLLSYLQPEPVKKPTAAEALKTSSAFGSTAPQKQGTLLAHLVKKKEESPAQVDGASDSRPPTADSAALPKRGRPVGAKAVKKETRVIDSDDDDTDIFAAVAKEAAKEPTKTTAASRAGRAATKQAPKYNLGSDSDDDDDDLLGDVSSMVKTIGAATNGVPMFKATTSARPGSNGTARPGSALAKKNNLIELDDDETNYEGLMPQPSPKRPAPRNVNDTIMSSDDDDFDLGVKKPAAGKLTAKPAAKPKAAPKPKVVPKKPAAQSPAAKAYAKKHGKDAAAPAPKKKAITIDSDEDEDMEDADAIANDILSDEDEDEPTPKPAAARPGRRAAAAKAAKYVVSDDDDEEDEASEPSFEDDDSE